MHTAWQRRRGFTIVELMVVVLIMGILATISVVGFNTYQIDTRDARRMSSATDIAATLEKYYDQNGEYPSCGALTADGATVVNTTLKGLDQNILVVPQATGATTNSIMCTSSGNSLSANGPDFFEYQGDNTASCNGNGSCLSFILKYKRESDGSIQTIASHHTS